MPKVNAIKTSGVVLTTTNGDSTVAATFATRTNAAYVIEARVLAIKRRNLLGAADDWGAVASYGIVATFINVAGTVVQAAGTAALWTHEEGDMGAEGADISISGTNIVVRVAGAPAQEIRWLVDTDIKENGADTFVPN